MAREGKAPAYLQYAGDWLADHFGWSLEECGASILLHCHAWHHGSLPAEPAELRKLLRCSARKFDELWVKISAEFSPRNPDGRLVNEEMERQRTSMRDESERQSKRAIKRWHGDAGASADRNAADPDLASPSTGNRQSLSSSSSSSSSRSETRTDPEAVSDRPSAPAAKPAPTPAAKPYRPADPDVPAIPIARRLSVEAFRVEFARVFSVLMPNGLHDAAQRIEAYAELSGTSDLEGLMVRAVAAFAKYRASLSVAFRGRPDGYRMVTCWPDIELILGGQSPAAADSREPSPIAQLDFAAGKHER